MQRLRARNELRVLGNQAAGKHSCSRGTREMKPKSRAVKTGMRYNLSPKAVGSLERI